MPDAPYQAGQLSGAPQQTSQWYSSLIYKDTPEAIFVQPISVKPTLKGLEFSLPVREVRETERRDTEIRYPHKAPLLITPVSFSAGRARLTKRGDWSIEFSMGGDAGQMLVNVAHGVPYAQIRLAPGDARISLPEGATAKVDSDRPTVLQVSAGRVNYAVFASSGANWGQSTGGWLVHLPEGKGYLSVAALPDSGAQTLALFARHVFSLIDDTRVAWNYDILHSAVQTTFSATITAMEGDNSTPLLGLYPHQWDKTPELSARLYSGYDTVRGKIRLLEASQFTVPLRYTGFVPYWPGVADAQSHAAIAEVMKADSRNARRMMLEEGRGPYWQGKGLQRITKLMDVAEQEGDLQTRDKLLALVKERAESWFTGEGGGYFHWNRQKGVVTSYPDEFFMVEQLNDHHFTYGYWIRAAADIALRDPAWASSEQWGGMVDLLIADIATPKRIDAGFPFLRNFDPYEGHSWASGISLGEMGNNQEASSEAVNAWAGLIIWAEIKGDKELRDLGIYLYSSEINSINHYWFDLAGQVFAPEYKNAEVSQVFGGMYAHNTWWIDDPRSIKGINLLPLTSASTYLGIDKEFVKRSLATLEPETSIYNARGRYAKPVDIWQDVFAEYRALADPDAALKSWNRWGSFELGDTRSHALHWMSSLKEMGTPDFSITADTPLYAVFTKGANQHTYLAFNPGAAPLEVHFSDGRNLSVAAHSLGRL